MKIKIILSLALLLTNPVHAEVFKCKSSANKTIYQKTPCMDAVDVKKIEIKKRSAEKDAQETAKLEAWTVNHKAEEQKELDAAKLLREENLRFSEVQAAQINAQAQREQVDAQNRQAKALENPRVFTPYTTIIQTAPPKY